jgi:PsbP-like protein
MYCIHMFPIVSAQNQSTLGSPEPVIKVLIDDAIRAIQNGNTTKTMQNLRVVDQMISEGNQNSSYLQASKLLIGDAIQALHNNDTSRAILYLNLTGQQLGVQILGNQTFGIARAASQGLLIYNSPVLGISIQYPSDWSLRQYEYNPAVNNTLVGFYSPSKPASELGNISGVSGNFVPYLDIFVFSSKNVSLNDIVKDRINTINKSSNFVINETKPISLKGNQSAYSIVYNSMAQGEHFKKMQVYTLSHNIVYLITFTAQDALFSNYLDPIRKMINSFEVTNSTARK